MLSRANAVAEQVGARFLDVTVAFPRFVLGSMLLPCLAAPAAWGVWRSRFMHYFHCFAIRPLMASRSMMSFVIIMIGGVLAMQLAALGVQDALEEWIARFAALVLAPLMACLYVLFRGYAPELVSLAFGLGRGEARSWSALGTSIWVQTAFAQFTAGLAAALALCVVQLVTLLFSSPMLATLQSLVNPGVRPFDLTLSIHPRMLALSLSVAVLSVGLTIAWCSFQARHLEDKPEKGGMVALGIVFPFFASFGALEVLAWLLA